MNNKFNVGDKVRAIGSLAIDGEHNRLGVIESVGTEESWVKWETELGIFSCKVSNNQLELIEQDTKEETPQTVGSENVLEEDTPKECCSEPSLDYKYEYNRLLEEHEELKELHEIALMMIKLGSELI
jgi:hypothetical protein